MQTISKKDWLTIPEKAQKEVYNFFLSVKERYSKNDSSNQEMSETKAYSNHSAKLVDDWQNDTEDDIWK